MRHLLRFFPLQRRAGARADGLLQRCGEDCESRLPPAARPQWREAPALGREERLEERLEDFAAGFDEDRLDEDLDGDFAAGLEDDRLDDFADGFDAVEDLRRDGDDFASPASARSLFTVRAAISSARPFWPRFS
jgi:hypothetical protein